MFTLAFFCCRLHFKMGMPKYGKGKEIYLSAVSLFWNGREVLFFNSPQLKASLRLRSCFRKKFSLIENSGNLGIYIDHKICLETFPLDI